MITTATASAVVKYHLAPTLVQSRFPWGDTPMFATEVTIRAHKGYDIQVSVSGFRTTPDGSRPDRDMALQTLVLGEEDEAALLDAMGVDLDSIASVVSSLA